jgi:hypothetical protein
MMNKKGYVPLAVLGGIIALLLFGGSIYRAFDGWIQSTTRGPEYCFENIDQSKIAVAAQGVSVRYTKIEGDILCFRTKDSSIVERLNQQIQDRELEENLAKIAASDRFWNETFPFLFLIGSAALVVIFIIMFLSNKNNNRGHY